jgi:probable F420-dependent oxidoreductase
MPAEEQPPMRIGAFIHPELPLAAAARRLEELGFDYAAVADHVAFHAPTTNAFVALGVAAGATERIGLLSAIALLPLYPAMIAAKLTAELAYHSGGRFELGVGVGGEYPPEFEACGVPVKERGARTDESLEVIRRLLTEERVSFEGRFSTLRDVTLSPRPQRPPDVWVGGRKAPAMERAARYGEVWMPYLYSPAQLADSTRTIRARARELGRDPSGISAALFAWIRIDDDRDRAVRLAADRLSAMYGTDMSVPAERYVLAGSVEEILGRLAEYRRAGLERLILSTLATDPAEHEEIWTTIAQAILPAAGGRIPQPAGSTTAPASASRAISSAE